MTEVQHSCIFSHYNSGRTVRFTLWNQDAHAFRKTEYDQAEKPIIITVTSCLVKDFGGKVID